MSWRNMDKSLKSFTTGFGANTMIFGQKKQGGEDSENNNQVQEKKKRRKGSISSHLVPHAVTSVVIIKSGVSFLPKPADRALSVGLRLATAFTTAFTATFTTTSAGSAAVRALVSSLGILELLLRLLGAWPLDRVEEALSVKRTAQRCPTKL
jgi:hypothetical protein